jgi:hypothetical protein
MWVDKVATKDNVADIGTKQVTPVAQFERLRDIVQGVNPVVVLTDEVREIIKGIYDRVPRMVPAEATAPKSPTATSDC